MYCFAMCNPLSFFQIVKTVTSVIRANNINCFLYLGNATTFCNAYSDVGNTACKGCEVSFSATDIRPQMHAITGCVNLKIIDILKSKVKIHLNIMDGGVMCCKLP